jgi:hypothetical protein
MGYPYSELVPAAILLKNPGITKKQFAELLERTIVADLREFSEVDTWNSGLISIPKGAGLYKLARNLRLNHRDEFKSWINSKKKDVGHGLILSPPDIQEWDLSVTSYIDEGFGDELEIEEWFDDRVTLDHLILGLTHEPETIFSENLGEYGIVTKVLGQRVEKCSSGDSMVYYRIKFRPSISSWKEEKFSSVDELARKWPQFHPEFMYDFSQRSGTFNVEFDEDSFVWKMDNDRYYLDKESFNRMPSGYFSTHPSRFGYVDLVLTAEAIRNKAWKLLSRCGLNHLDQFLEDFPDSRKRYEAATWDSFTSLYAKKNQLTYTDFLRTRLEMKLS